jgi:hypothetical protein
MALDPTKLFGDLPKTKTSGDKPLTDVFKFEDNEGDKPKRDKSHSTAYAKIVTRGLSRKPSRNLSSAGLPLMGQSGPVTLGGLFPSLLELEDVTEED